MKYRIPYFEKNRGEDWRYKKLGYNSTTTQYNWLMSLCAASLFLVIYLPEKRDYRREETPKGKVVAIEKKEDSDA